MKKMVTKRKSLLKKLGLTVLFILMLSAISGTANADPGDVVWFKTYDFACFETDIGDTVNFTGTSAAETQDGGYILAGYVQDPTTNYKAFLIKVDAEGDTLWFRYYGPDDDYNYYGINVFPETDGGYMLAGNKEYGEIITPPGYPIGVFLIKFDADGDTVWTNLYSDEDDTYCSYILNNAHRTSDGDYVLCGYANRGTASTPSLDGFIAKIDADGNELWTHYFSAPDSDAERSHMLFIGSRQTDDGGTIIGGAIQAIFSNDDTGHSYSDNYGLLIKFDADGDSVWTYQYGEHDQIFDVCETSGGGYIVSDLNLDLRGSEASYFVDGFTALKLDESRNEVWNDDMSYEGGEVTDTSIVGHAVCEMPNSEGYVFAGTKGWLGVANDDSEMWPENHLFLAQYDTLGNGELRIYETEFGTADSMPIVPFDIKVKENGNYIIAGYVDSYISITYGVWLRPTKAFLAEIEGGMMVSIDDNHSSALPERLTLNQNYPNPFNATTKIQFSLNKSDDVILSVYDILGRRVTTLYDGSLVAGNHSITWNGTSESGDVVSSGVYFYRLETSDDVSTRQMILLK